MSNLLKLTPENYYTKEANMQYVSVSQYKEFNGTTGKMGCEAYAMAKLRGEVEEVTTTALMVGSYVDAYFEGTLPTFSAQHPEIFSSRGKTAGELKSEYKQASIMIDRAVKDPVFMQYMAGDKQVIMTGEIEGVPVKIKIDSADGRRITDLKTVKSITETFYAKDLGQRLNFCEWWGYDLQAAVYREIYRQNTGDLLPFYMIGYGVIRCFVEGLRTDSLHLMPGVRVSQVLSGCLILLGVLLIGIIRRRQNIQA